MNMFTDAYAECAARFVGHLYGQTLGDQTQRPRYSPLGDEQIARLIFLKFIQMTPRVKKVTESQENKVLDHLDLVDNVMYVTNSATGCIYRGQDVIRFNPQIEFVQLTTYNGDLAIKDSLNQIRALGGLILAESEGFQQSDLERMTHRVRVNRSYFRLRRPTWQYREVSVESGYFLAMTQNDHMFHYEIYDPKKFRWGVPNEPMAEFDMITATPDMIEFHRIHTLGNLMYVIGRDIFLIDMSKGRVIHHFGPIQSAYQWQPSTWGFVNHSRVRPNGNLLLLSQGTVYEIEL